MELNDYVREVSKADFGKPFRHQASWNPRLQTTGGRFFPKDGHLDFNPKVYQELGLDVFRKIVRHELCHYHLYYANKGFHHRDQTFKDLLAAVDGLRYTPPLRTVKIRYTYQCQGCYQIYRRQRAIDTTRLVCGHCKGKLDLKNQSKG
ncbi:SprT family protein [Streptococcus halichoeri]|uniref:SprT family protein n=1 Tax=Streptococcus halichoeri TaxID=254785 RepID=UPI001359137C|nr:SprT family protein [Streptococcus halichoeri]